MPLRHIIRGSSRGKTIILMYHRVADLRPDPWSLCVNPGHFEEHLDVLMKHCRPIRLEELASSSSGGKAAGHTFAITFDDGYADIIQTVMPALKKRGIPSTVFLPVEVVRSGKQHWWDELECIFLEPGELPASLSIAIKGKNYGWELGDEARYDNIDHEKNLSWRVSSPGRPGIRQAIYLSVYNLLRPFDYEERHRKLEELAEWAGRSRTRDVSRILSVDDVASMASETLLDIGSHTMTHPDMTLLNGVSLNEELRQSKALLEEMTGRPVKCLSYPFGLHNKETVSAVKDAGYMCACTASAGIVTTSTNRLALPRFNAEDCKGDEFEKRLKGWLRNKI